MLQGRCWPSVRLGKECGRPQRDGEDREGPDPWDQRKIASRILVEAQQQREKEGQAGPEEEA